MNRIFINGARARTSIPLNGIVMFMNKTYVGILGCQEEDVVGKYIGDITPESRTLIVIENCKAILGYNWSINGYNIICSCMPLIQNDELVACFGQ